MSTWEYVICRGNRPQVSGTCALIDIPRKNIEGRISRSGMWIYPSRVWDAARLPRTGDMAGTESGADQAIFRHGMRRAEIYIDHPGCLAQRLGTSNLAR